MRSLVLISSAVLLLAGSPPVPRTTNSDAPRLRESLDAGWRFHRGDIAGGERRALDDRSWRELDVPHDWSLEDLPPATDPSMPPVIALVPGRWRFKAEDAPAFKQRDHDDAAWREVSLPEPWSAHGGSGAARAVGWYRRRIELPAGARGRDVIVALGRINDADEAFVNGVKVGGRGNLPPQSYDPFWNAGWPFGRFYRVPARLLRGDGRDVVALRVMGGPGHAGIYEAAPASASGPFAPALSEGEADTGHVVGGTAWYRRQLTAPAAWRGRRVSIEFEGVYRNAEVFVNGTPAGRRPYGYSTFVLDITPHLELGGKPNVIAVKVTNDGSNSRWYSGSGILRHVWLHVTPPLRLAHWGVFVTTPEVTPDKATVRAEATVENAEAGAADVALRVRLRSPAGEEVAAAETAVAGLAAGERRATVLDLAVAAPQRWTLDSPSLYRAEVEVLRGGIVADRVEVPFGIRTVEIDPERGFRLNGAPMKLRGACVHHDNGPLGAAAIDRAEERKIELLKANGYNAVRTSHAPPAPAFLEAADRLGLLVMDESFDMWRRSKRPADYAKDFDTWWMEDLDAMVLRDRNHPSVVMWSIGNEVPERAEPEGFTYARRLAGRVRALDPTRAVTAALNDVGPRRWEETDGTFAALDVAGYNYLPDKYAADHRRMPSRVIVATESFPRDAFEAWTAVEDNAHVIGDFVWTGIDYLGESGIGHTWDAAERGSFLLEYPWHVSNCGDLDLCGWKRPPSFYRDVLWRRGAPLTLMVHSPSAGTRTVSRWGWPDVVPSWSWAGHEGRPLTVDVYSAVARVDLFLDEAKLGSQPTSRATRFTASFTVPYRPGVLRAVGYDAAGAEVGRSELRTPGAPVALRAAVDRSRLTASRNDLAYVTVDVVDARGDRVLTAGPTLTVRLSGPAELAAVANANPMDVSSYRGTTRQAWQGRALAIVRPTGRPGAARLEVVADGLTAASIAIAIQ